MAKKRILYVGGFKLPDKNAAAQRVMGNAKALREIGYDVIFLDVKDEILDNRISDAHEIEGFTVYSQRHASDMIALFQYSVSPVHVLEILKKYDGWYAVIAYNYPAIALEKLRRICCRRRIRCYSDCTEWYGFDSFSVKNLFILIDTFLRMRIVQKKLDGIICISRFLENYYHLFTKTIIIPPLVDIRDEKWTINVSRKEKTKELIYSGSPGNRKDKLDEIIHAIKDVSNARLRIVGITKEQYLKVYPRDKDIVEKLLLSGNIEFCGRISHREAIEYVKKSDYSIFFRQKTRANMAGFPTKFVESISCGVPVITTNTSDLHRYVESEKNGIIINSKNFQGAVHKIIRKGRRVPVERDLFDYRLYVNQIKNFIEE